MAYDYKPDPAPAIIDGEEWEIRDSGDPRRAYVDFTSQTMVVPMDESDQSRIIRAHEAIHVKITPRHKNAIPKEIPNRTGQCFEDCRVYSSMLRTGIEASGEVLFSDAEYRSLKERSNLNQVTALEKCRIMVATRNTGDRKLMQEMFEPELADLVNDLVEPVFGEAEKRGEIPTFEQAMSLGIELHKRLKEEEEKGTNGTKPGETERQENSDKQQDELSAAYGRSSGELQAQVTANPNEWVNADELTDEETRRLNHENIPSITQKDGKWGDPEWMDLKLTERLPIKDGFGRKHLSSDTGAVPRNMHRMPVDQKVFARVKREGTATVLIDCSGSMSITDEEVIELLKLVPSATIAAYTGFHNRNKWSRGKHGRISIIAANRKAVNQTELRRFREEGGENLIDGPALEWLAKQKSPRIWISDGRVTAVSRDRCIGFPAPNVLVRMARTIRRAGIIRIGTYKQAYKALENPRTLKALSPYSTDHVV